MKSDQVRRVGLGFPIPLAFLLTVVLAAALTGCAKQAITLRILYTGDTVGYLEPCG